jgi:hypothetical protein
MVASKRYNNSLAPKEKRNWNLSKVSTTGTKIKIIKMSLNENI